jgi:hypothetical protein
VGYFCNFEKTRTKVNNHPLGENSPNLVTLLPLPPSGKAIQSCGYIIKLNVTIPGALAQWTF